MTAGVLALEAGESIERQVYAERVALLYRLTPQTLATAVVFSIAVFFYLRPEISGTVLLYWLIANNTVSLLRYLDIRAYRRAVPSLGEARRWHRRFVILALCAGTIWGLMGTLLLPLGKGDYQSVVVVFLVGTAAVGLFTLSSSAIAYAALAGPVLVPPAIYFLFSGEESGVTFGVLLFAFTVLVVVNARRSVANTAEMLRLRFDNARIAAEREQARRAAEQAGRARLQFLANMSHEIRTPLNGILGMAQLLEASPLDTTQRHRLRAISGSGQHLLGLINDILDFSKMEAGKLDVIDQAFELRRLPREVLDILTARAEERGLRCSWEVDPEAPAWLRGDAARLKQILLNLVGNAIKFTDRGSVEVRVTCGPLAAEPGMARLRFAVRDTGVGIAPADQAVLFEAFTQVDASATRRHGGTGLGLVISKQLVELMGGAIGCQSVPGEGSTFWFEVRLPVASEPAAGSAATDKSGRRRFAASVLLVEDNPVNSEVAAAMLEGLGIAVTRAEDGLRGLDAAKAGSHDLILMDCQMPGMDGFEATRRIIEHEHVCGLPHTPIVALTANAIRGDREACLAAGMDDYLAKPFALDELASILDRWLPQVMDA